MIFVFLVGQQAKNKIGVKNRYKSWFSLCVTHNAHSLTYLRTLLGTRQYNGWSDLRPEKANDKRRVAPSLRLR